MAGIGLIVLLVLAYPFIAAWMVGASRNGRLDELEREVASLRKTLERFTSVPGAGQAEPESGPLPQTEAGPESETIRSDQNRPNWWVPPEVEIDQSPQPETHPETEPEIAPVPVAASVSGVAQTEVEGSRKPAYSLPGWVTAAKTWLITGNPVAKIGLVILFIGVAFLLKYVAATVIVPIELRLAGVVLADLALLGWGWRLRTSRREIGLPVQGAAIAILMLVIFGAYQRYGLLPAGFAFALLVLLTVFTCLLAVLQDAFWLALFGITGGFACPLMVATGQGNHIALFSYYALLNAGVFALAILRNWRPLNLLGFAFTFVVGTAWGGLRYTPDNYLSAQAFLILFFVFYVGIALAYARRQQIRLKDYVDGTLVLGTPLLAFGLQVGLVKDKPFGLAISALALGGFYMTLALVLWRQGRERWRLLVETTLTLAVIFGTLAIPFALDARWTSGAWALEGAGFVWIGLRRGRRRTWMFGLLLQAGAWLSFAGSAAGLDANAALASNLWLGFAALAGGAFAIATGLRRYANSEAPVVSTLASLSLAIAAVWLLAGWWTESIIRTSGGVLANWLVSGAMLTTVLLVLIAVRMSWTIAGLLALIAQVAGAVGLIAVSATSWTWLDVFERDGDKPLLGTVMIAAAAFATSRMVGRMSLRAADKGLSPVFLAWAGIWWFGPVIGIIAGRMAPYLPVALGEPFSRWTLLYATGVAVSVTACMELAPRLRWPQLRWLSSACWAMLVGVTAAELIDLYADRAMPDPAAWLAWLLLLASSEYVMRSWASGGALLNRKALQAMHALRTAGPWLAVWPAGSILVDRWLRLGGAQDLVAAGAWATSAAWSNYLPTWAMMLVLAMLLKRSGADKWPTRPLSDWYRAVVIPCGALLMLVLVGVWNLSQDGTMMPLPYLPLLNPLDLTSGFALMLSTGAMEVFAKQQEVHAKMHLRLRVALMVLGYIWFNLMMLRSAAHYLGIAYQLEALAASQFVQAMLSLVWSTSALIIMRYAAQRMMRRTWGSGAVLLCIVVGKLFLVDLASGGSMARIVSFVGVGLLMLSIGYIAPYPKVGEGVTSPSSSA